MRKAEWYVMQVETGREQATCDAVLRACAGVQSMQRGEPLVSECFAPRYRHRYKLHGQWHDEDCLLLPGYVVAVTSEPWALGRALGRVPGFTRLLTMGETFAPLKDEDRFWIERWTREGDRTIPMSIAHKKGDRVVVAEGPLKGREGMITRVKRRLGLAELEFHVGTVTVRTTVGLAVLPGEDEPRREV